MRQNLYAWLVGILLVTLIAGYIDIVDTVPGFNYDVKVHQGLDLVGGLQLVLQAQPRGNQASVSQDQLNAARDIIEQRANSTGASEPVVQTAGTDRILVELPQVYNLEEATQIVQQTAFLEFIDSGSTPLSPGTLVCTQQNGCPRTTETSTGTSGTTPGSTPAANATTVVTSTGTVSGTTGTTAATPSPTPALQTYNAVVSGDDIDGSKVAVVFDQANQPEVQFVLKGNAPSTFASFTSSHVGQYMPIILDKKVINSPVIQGAITGGQGVINGLTLQDAQVLAAQLRAGALPVSLSLLKIRKISATLGQEAVNRSIVAAIIGLGLVVLFMLVYYRLPGALADVALVIYAIWALAVQNIPRHADTSRYRRFYIVDRHGGGRQRAYFRTPERGITLRKNAGSRR